MSLRLFIAIDPGLAARKALGELCFAIPHTKWVPVDKMHLTLQFIGETNPEQYQAIRDILHEVHHGPLDLHLRGVGHFQTGKKESIRHVLWAGVEESDELLALQTDIAQKMKSIGLILERKKYRPHITLGKTQSATPSENIAQFLACNALWTSPPTSISHFALYSSKLKEDGAEYQIEESYKL